MEYLERMSKSGPAHLEFRRLPENIALFQNQSRILNPLYLGCAQVLWEAFNVANNDL